jgi:chorismate mutase
MSLYLVDSHRYGGDAARMRAESAGEGRADGSAARDAVLRRLRSDVVRTDRAIAELFNRRLELVRLIKRRKEELGLPFVDPEREREMLRDLERAHRGTVSDAGLAELQTALLDLTKRELDDRGVRPA